MNKEGKKMIKDFENAIHGPRGGCGGSLDDLRKFEIVHSLFNKFGTAIELAEYLNSKGVDVE